MGTRDQIDELKQLAADLEKVADAEDAFMAAKDAYRADKSEKNKAAYHEASAALTEARQAVRSDESSRVVAPGDVSLTPATVKTGKE
jgi:hypothetical protein